MSSDLRKSKLGVAVLLIVFSLTVVPGVAVGQSGITGNIVVGPDETVSSIDAVAGTILIQGTVTGDVSGVAGTVQIDGTVEGDVNVAAGDITIRGAVHGDISAGAGNIEIHEGAVVGGDFEVGAATVTIDGVIDGNARVGAETIVLGDEAQISGSLTYDGDLQGNTDAVEGDITRDRSLGVDLFGEVQPFVAWFFTVSIFALNLLVGAILLGLFPNVSNRISQRVRTDTVRSGLAGFAVLLFVPILLVAAAITIIGIPITIVGSILFAMVVWIGLIYGRFALGMWLLSLVDIDNHWVGLVVGLLIGTLVWEIPVLGGLVNFLLVILGTGALVYELYLRRRNLQEYPHIQ